MALKIRGNFLKNQCCPDEENYAWKFPDNTFESNSGPLKTILQRECSSSELAGPCSKSKLFLFWKLLPRFANHLVKKSLFRKMCKLTFSFLLWIKDKKFRFSELMHFLVYERGKNYRNTFSVFGWQRSLVKTTLTGLIKTNLKIALKMILFSRAVQ